MSLVIGLVLIAIGLVMIFKPHFFYDITEGWKHATGGAPSDFYILHTRIGGVVFVLAGAISPAVSFVTVL